MKMRVDAERATPGRRILIRRLGQRAAADAAIVAVAAVMAFGQVQFVIHLMVFGNADYDPLPMTYLFYPVFLGAAAVGWARVREIGCRISGKLAGKRNRVRIGPAEQAAFIAAVSAASAGAAELLSGGAPTAAAAVTVGATVGIAAHLRFSVARWLALGEVAEIRGRGRTARRGFRSLTALRRGRAAESAVIVVGSVMTFGLVEFFVNIVLGRNPDYSPIDMLGMIPTMTIIMGTISYVSLRAAGRSIVGLISGIERVASGDFSAELDGKRAGPYREVFDNFNAMTRELRSIRTLRDDFINHFSHEFKTPIASINGFARILQEETLPEEERKRYLGIIAAESERLAAMAGNALAMATLDSQEFLPSAESFALDEELRQCAILLAPQWTAKGIDLTADLEPVAVRGSADLLRRVWINLLGNAVKFTPPGGRVSVELKNQGDRAEVTISDTGAGMTAEELSRVFEKYYQGASGRAAKGLGLGLSIARRIVQLSGGEISARSRPGEGSAFTVRLPV